MLASKRLKRVLVISVNEPTRWRALSCMNGSVGVGVGGAEAEL